MDRRKPHVERAGGEQLVHRRPENLRRNIVEVRFEADDGVGFVSAEHALALDERAEDGAQDIRTRRQVARADTVADLLDLELRHEAEGRSKFRENRGAGRRDEFVRFIDLADRNALQDFQRRRCGQWEGAVGAGHRAGAVMQAGDEDFLHAERLDARAGTDNVRDRIECTHFVKVNILRRLPVNLAFRDGDALKDGKRVLLHEGRQFAVLDQFADLAVGPAMRVIVAVVMLVDFAPVIVVVFQPMLVMVLVFVRMRVFVAVLMLVSMGVFMSVPVFVILMFAVLVAVVMLVLLLSVPMLMMLMLVRMGVPFPVFMPAIMMVFVPVLVVLMAMVVLVLVMLILVVRMCRAFMDAKFHPFHFLPLLPVEVHVKIADVELGKLPLEGRWFDAEIAKRADCHVAADAGETIEKENFHGSNAEGWMVLVAG